jgi:hypothetical protein
LTKPNAGAVGRACSSMDSLHELWFALVCEKWFDSYRLLSYDGSMAGNGLIGLRDMFSLKAVERPKLVPCSLGVGSKGSVSDRFTRFLRIGTLLSTEASLLCECFLVEDGGDGRRVPDVENADGNRACDCDWDRLEGFLVFTGTGRLLKVLLLGMPPMGSSGRHT